MLTTFAEIAPLHAALYALDAYLEGRRITRIMQPKADREVEVVA